MINDRRMTLPEAVTKASQLAAESGRRHRVIVCTCPAWGGVSHFLILSVDFDPGRFL